MATRLETAAAKRAEGQKALDALVAAAKKNREAARKANVPVFVGDWNGSNFPLYDVETGLRVGIVSGKTQAAAKDRIAGIVAERADMNAAAAEAATASAAEVRALNDEARAAALAALKPAKPATDPKTEEG